MEQYLKDRDKTGYQTNLQNIEGRGTFMRGLCY
jgi:hypothetical protein